jgi:hypothetical protein
MKNSELFLNHVSVEAGVPQSVPGLDAPDFCSRLLKLRLPLIELVAGDAQFQRKLRGGFLPQLQEPHRFKLELLGKAGALTFRVDLLTRLSHPTPPRVLSPFKRVR